MVTLSIFQILTVEIFLHYTRCRFSNNTQCFPGYWESPSHLISNPVIFLFLLPHLWFVIFSILQSLFLFTFFSLIFILQRFSISNCENLVGCFLFDVFIFFYFYQSFLLLLIFSSTLILFFLLECNIMLNCLIRKKIRIEQRMKIIVTYLGVGCFSLFLIDFSFTSFISSSCLFFLSANLLFY